MPVIFFSSIVSRCKCIYIHLNCVYGNKYSEIINVSSELFLQAKKLP